MPSRYIHVSAKVDLADVLFDMDDTCLREECERRGILLVKERPARTDAKFADACERAAYDVDSWMHDLRASFMARDHRHFDVLLSRYEGRFRAELINALALEAV